MESLGRNLPIWLPDAVQRATTCRHFSQGYSVPPDFSVELALQQQGVWPVAGVDEAGCGPLAGPVVAAAVILNLHDIPAGLDDSKKLAAKAREKLFEDINLRAACIGIAVISASKIDIINIRNAALLAMQRAIAALSAAPAHVLADGRNVPPGLACSCRAIVRGDGASCSIAAASIVAKVTRDRLMHMLDAEVPNYGFARHMGYATPAHLEALARFGPSQWHRMSFAPMRESGVVPRLT